MAKMREEHAQMIPQLAQIAANVSTVARSHDSIRKRQTAAQTTQKQKIEQKQLILEKQKRDRIVKHAERKPEQNKNSE